MITAETIDTCLYLLAQVPFYAVKPNGGNDDAEYARACRVRDDLLKAKEALASNDQ